MVESDNQLSFRSDPAGMGALPVLCTQSTQYSQPGTSIATVANSVYVAAAGNRYQGYRNQKSFRFLGIPYADEPARFQHSHLHSSRG